MMATFDSSSMSVILAVLDLVKEVTRWLADGRGWSFGEDALSGDGDDK